MYFDAFEELDIADDSDEEEEYHNAMDEIEIAMVMNRTERSALNQEETANFDIDPNTQQTNDYGPNIMRTWAEWDERKARAWTGFSIPQLREISSLFALNVGDVRVPHQNRHYVFSKLEIFLFGSCKLYSGMDNQQLCDCLFGGSPRRWSNAYKWFLEYIDSRYSDTLDFVGLRHEVDNFPIFAKAIARKMNTERFRVNPTTGQRYAVLSAVFDEAFARIFSFLDGTYFQSSAPGTGPHGDYEGSDRRPNWYIVQRAVYTGYKKLHGLHLLTIMLPNGINYLFGPNSARGGDATSMADSECNEFLEDLQRGIFVLPNGNQAFYASHGDGLFAPRSCISRDHKATRNSPLNIFQDAENSSLRSVRVTIEHSYAFVRNKFKILRNTGEFMLKQERPHASFQLRVVFLYSNISICLNGSQVSGVYTFACPPPTLQDYLRL